MRTGQNIRAALLVINGRIKIYREDEAGNEFFMYYLGSAKPVRFPLFVPWGRKPAG